MIKCTISILQGFKTSFFLLIINGGYDYQMTKRLEPNEHKIKAYSSVCLLYHP